MLVKAQYRNQKKFIKIPEACFDLFLAEVKEKFSLPQDLVITVTDETGTEVDEDVFPDLMSTSGLLLVINALNDSGPSTPQSSASFDTDTLSLTSKSSEDSDWFSPKRFRKDEDEASQNSQARDLIKQILETRPGGANVLREYEDTGTITDETRKVMVNILVAHMMETEGRVPHRLTKQKYGLGIITLFPSPHSEIPKGGLDMNIFMMARKTLDSCRGDSKPYKGGQNLLEIKMILKQRKRGVLCLTDSCVTLKISWTVIKV